MTIQDARKLRDHIKATLGCHCTVPYNYAPDRYFAVIWTSDTPSGACCPKKFRSQEEFDEWFAEREKRRIARELLSKPRSPLDMMIDKACGIE